MPNGPARIDRLYDLLIQQCTEPLSVAETEELHALQVKWPHVDADSLALDAAAVLAGTVPSRLPPVDARRQADLQESADGYFQPAQPAHRKRRNIGALSGWIVAASLLMVWGARSWLRFDEGAVAVPSLEQQREELLSRGARRFAATPQATRSGDAVWDAAIQRGYLSLSGLPKNDPAKSQYQLWIVDRGRKQAEPVDGGVFDIVADGPTIVPIRATLPIRDASLFAITEEPPGGVVVSERGRNGDFVLVLSNPVP